MSEPVQHKPGDIVNGHRLTDQPDGSWVWLPVNAGPQPEPADVGTQYKPGDVVNGHRLTDQDGTMTWLPVLDAAPKKSRRGQWIAWGVSTAAVLALLIFGIVSVITADPQGSTGANAPSAEVTEQQPEPDVTIPSFILGMDADSAIDALKGIGLVVSYSGPGDAIVTAIDPAQGAVVEEGTVITFTVHETPRLTLAQQNAVGQAESYLSHSSFSRIGLIGQLEFEGYSTQDATFAVDFIAADWNQQAALKAESYLSHSSFSREGLYDQLIFEGFSDAEANSGLAAVGY